MRVPGTFEFLAKLAQNFAPNFRRVFVFCYLGDEDH